MVRFVLLVIVGFSNSTAWGVSPTEPPGTLVDIGGRSLHLNCTGSGSPTVVLDAGLGGNSLEWALVQSRVANFSRVCSYDRAGYGWSDPGPQPRTSSVIASELHAALLAAEVGPPYVIVGHSFGGFNARLFAARYPGESVGLVLVDAAHEEQFERLARGPAPTRIVPRGHLYTAPPLSVPEGIPMSLRATARQLAAAPKARRAALSELLQFEHSAVEVERDSPHLDLPLVIVSRSAALWKHSPEAEQLERTWSQLQREMRKLSDHSVQIFAGSTSHHIHLKEPELVARAIRQVVDAVRGRPSGP